MTDKLLKNVNILDVVSATDSIIDRVDGNFIPAGTTINVKTDGTGDFTKLSDAINYLNNKWSNGEITIQLGSGTFDESSQIDIKTYAIPSLVITGNSKTTTIIRDSRSTSTSSQRVIYIYSNVTIKNLKLQGVTSTVNNNYRGLDAWVNLGTLVVQNVAFSSFGLGLSVSYGSCCIGGTLDFSSCNQGISVACGGIVASVYGIICNFTSCTTAYAVTNNGGQIHLMGSTSNYTSVTNRVSQTVGTATNMGWITGVTI